MARTQQGATGRRLAIAVLIAALEKGITLEPLRKHPPTAEQLVLVRDNDPGDVLVRGAAGSGKTTTSLLRLELVTRYWIDRRDREGSTEPIRVLALAFNRTLVGYIRELAYRQVPVAHPLVELEVETVAGFNRKAVGYTGSVWEKNSRDGYIWSLARRLGYSRQFILDEVDYVLGRFPPNRLGDYLTSTNPRLGRGRTPIVDADDRTRIYNEVLLPLGQYKDQYDLVDWNDLAVLAAATTDPVLRQVAVVDEAQDFSVNQLRSVVTHLAPEHSLTVVTDTAQRIYPRYLFYPEAGIGGFKRIYQLTRNFRNTPAIAALAAGVLAGLTLDADAAMPQPASAGIDPGVKPHLLVGEYSKQLNWVITELGAIDLKVETAAILTLRGGQALNYTRNRLRIAGLDFVELQTTKEWPDGDANLAISTLHSAKGLEFDNVFILGLSAEFTEHDGGEDDATLDRLRRLLGMAIGRARTRLAIGYKSGEASELINYIDPNLVDAVDVGTKGQP